MLFRYKPAGSFVTSMRELPVPEYGKTNHPSVRTLPALLCSSPGLGNPTPWISTVDRNLKTSRSDESERRRGSTGNSDPSSTTRCPNRNGGNTRFTPATSPSATMTLLGMPGDWTTVEILYVPGDTPENSNVPSGSIAATNRPASESRKTVAMALGIVDGIPLTVPLT